MASAKSKGIRSAQHNDASPIRKVHSRHTWKLESISHGHGPPVSRKAVQYVLDEVAKRRNEKFHFSKQEIESLCTIFRHLTKNADKIDRNRFRDILHNTFDMTDDILMDRVFKAFDRDNDGQVNMLEWIIGLNTYLRGTLDEKIAFAFNCYSLKGEKHITREEIFQLLKSSVLKQAGDEDPDETCFGQVFPNQRRKNDFEKTLEQMSDVIFGQSLSSQQLAAIFDY
ncbi:unnamed protein product [Didymodactylos carnosus]|uniref:EF-hand domain-containing protein n=1 Tax=Didymodactylos carnosus TaxID=1234261 RepID=A0A814A950_9BILA|nr:unnamed protein product [Didymodactylos carnosus]CAF0911359.1 unnamed protein product [Didymodactylos carnosus]CAF3610520.1 unnamed protein product [Didymodactylos carnosus]CAF3692483.1 unnamed protein product [Didymodactylos carnosus]